MEGTKTWLNRKVVNLLGDFKIEREPHEEPSPTRGLLRIVFVLAFTAGFLCLGVFLFRESPDVRLKQLDHLQDFGDHKHQINTQRVWDSLYNINASGLYGLNRMICPCTNTTVMWKDFLSFSALRQNPKESWNMTFGWDERNSTERPRVYLDNEHFRSLELVGKVVKDAENLTVESFCKRLHVWPGLGTVDIQSYRTSPLCNHIATILLEPENSSHREFKQGSAFGTGRSTILESPLLLSREDFYMVVTRRARDVILRSQVELDMLNYGNQTAKKLYNNLAYLLTGPVADRREMEEWERYYLGALRLARTLIYKSDLNDPFPSILYLKDDKFDQLNKGLIFLHPQVDWMKYYNACSPTYCMEAKWMSYPRQAYWALGILGGVASITLGFVSMVLWPLAALVLRRYFSKHSAGFVTEDPKATLLHSGGSDEPALQSHDLEASVASIPGASSEPELHRRVSQQSRHI